MFRCSWVILTYRDPGPPPESQPAVFGERPNAYGRGHHPSVSGRLLLYPWWLIGSILMALPPRIGGAFQPSHPPVRARCVCPPVRPPASSDTLRIAYPWKQPLGYPSGRMVGVTEARGPEPPAMMGSVDRWPLAIVYTRFPGETASR